MEDLDKTLYIKLLKKAESLKTEGKSLWNENREEYFELLSYGILLEGQISYNRKDDYLSLIEDYRRGTIDAVIFRLAFLKMSREDNQTLDILKKDLKRLSTFSIDSKSEGFSSLIGEILGICDALFDFDSEDSSEITENQFRDSENQFRDAIEQIFFEMQKFFDGSKN
jgi:hypothetical protein